MTEDIRVKELYSLQLARYAYLQENDSSCGVENSSQIIDRRDFFLFDYFDRLICKKGASLNCNTCFGFTELNKENPPYVTSQFITLADLHEDNNDSPFFCNSNALPFLALIIINIYPAQEQSIERKANNGDQKTGYAQEVNNFLNACHKELKNKIEAVINQRKIAINHADTTLAEFCLYNSINTGDFCVALRAADPSLFYQIAAAINETKIGAAGLSCFPRVCCSTYTNVGIKLYSRSEDQEYWNFYNIARQNNRAGVVLRVVANDYEAVTDAINSFCKAENKSCVDCQIIDVNCCSGLFGRYDFRLYLTLEQFWIIYPALCKAKFGDDQKWADWEQYSRKINDGAVRDVLALQKLYDCIKDKKFNVINERIFVEPGPVSTDETKIAASIPSARHQKIFEQNKLILTKLEEAAKITLPDKNQNIAYQNCLHLIERLWNSYSNLRYQVDSYINGNMFYAQILMLLELIMPQVSLFSLDNEAANTKNNYKLSTEAYYDLDRNIRVAVNSINDFNTYLQSMNRQSFQAPNYEIPVQMDMEKYIVAYTEFCRSFSAGYYTFVRNVYSKKFEIVLESVPQILPILTIDSNEDAIFADPLFLAPYGNDNGVCVAQAIPERLINAITAPDIKALGLPYSTLPSLCHELCHHLNVDSRSNRNHILANFILYSICYFFVQKWLVSANDRISLDPPDEITSELADGIREVLFTEYVSSYAMSLRKSNIDALTSNLQQFLCDNFLLPDNDMDKTDYSKLVSERLEYDVKELCAMLERPWLQSAETAFLDAVSAWLTDKERYDKKKIKTICELVDEITVYVVGEKYYNIRACLVDLYVKLLQRAIAEVSKKNNIDIEKVNNVCREIEKCDDEERIDKLEAVKKILHSFINNHAANDVDLNRIFNNLADILAMLKDYNNEFNVEYSLQDFSTYYKSFLADMVTIASRIVVGVAVAEKDAQKLQRIFFGEKTDDCPQIKVADIHDYIQRTEIALKREDQLDTIKMISLFCYYYMVAVQKIFACGSCIVDAVYIRSRFWRELFGYYQFDGDSITQNRIIHLTDTRKEIRKAIFLKLKKKLMTVNSTRSRVIDRVFVPLGLKSNTIQYFEDSFTKTLSSLSMDSVISIIDNKAKLFREAVADLGMCAMLGLNAFGYMKVLAYNNNVTANSKNNISQYENYKAFSADRILLVLNCLLRCYSHEQTAENMERVSLDIENPVKSYLDRTEEIQEQIQITANNLHTEESEAKMIQGTVNIVASLLAYYRDVAEKLNEKLNETSEVQDDEKSQSIVKDKEILCLNNLYRLIEIKSKRLVSGNNAELEDYLAEIYRRIANNDLYCPWMIVSDDPLIGEVGRFYNQTTWQGYYQLGDSNEIFKKTVAFILKLYYQNWCVYHNAFNNTGADKEGETGQSILDILLED